MNGWGERKDLDFWTARARGEVPAQEQRAMTLLASLSDEARFAFYARYGMYPALGNMSRRVYFVRRFATVMETSDGQPVASWCVVTHDRGTIPETDHVVALKNLIEGEEAAFREIGNRGGSVFLDGSHERVRTPFAAAGFEFRAAFFGGFADGGEMDRFEPLALKDQMASARAQAIRRHEDTMRAALKKAPDYVEPPPPPRAEISHGGIGFIQGAGAGAVITDNTATTMGVSMGLTAGYTIYAGNGGWRT